MQEDARGKPAASTKVEPDVPIGLRSGSRQAFAVPRSESGPKAKRSRGVPLQRRGTRRSTELKSIFTSVCRPLSLVPVSTLTPSASASVKWF